MWLEPSDSQGSQEVDQFSMCDMSIATTASTEISSVGECCQSEKVLHYNHCGIYQKWVYFNDKIYTVGIGFTCVQRLT